MLQKLTNWVELHKQLALIILLVVVALLVGVGVTASIINSRLRIVSTTPKLGSMSFLEPDINLTFNQALSSNNLQLTSSPNVINHVTVSGDVLTVYLLSMKVGKTYSINLVSIESASGKTIKNKTITFKTLNIPYSDLTHAEQQQIINGGTTNNGTPTKGAISQLPHLAIDYQLLGSFVQGTNQPDILFNYTPDLQDIQAGQSAYNAALANAEAWLSQAGLSSYPLYDYTSGAKLN